MNPLTVTVGTLRSKAHPCRRTILREPYESASHALREKQSHEKTANPKLAERDGECPEKTFRGPRFTFYVSRFTFYVLRFTFYVLRLIEALTSTQNVKRKT